MNASLLRSITAIFVTLLTARVQSETKVSFVKAGTFDTGAKPTSIAVGDFNDDGKPDLAVANEISGNVSVLLGLGGGVFDTAVNYDTESGPVSVAIGDFNTNGILDLAVANGGSTNVSVLLGNGDGTFQAGIAYGVGDGPRSVAVGDFNSDNKPDLAVANRLSGDVSVLLGNGNGTFVPAVNYGAGVDPVSVAIGAFNADARTDLAVANAALFDVPPSVSVLLGNSNGTFQAATNYGAGTSPRSVAVADFNADGRLDLVAANFGSFVNGSFTNSKVSVLLGNGDGTFQSSLDYYAGDGSIFVSTGDFDSDDRLDCLVINNRSTNVAVLSGNGIGTFAAPVFFDAGMNPLSAGVGDFNGDGQPDLAVANTAGVLVLLNTTIALSIVRSNNAVIISWPFPAAGFTLESKTNLISSNWKPAPELATNNTGRWEVVVPLSQPQRYFRLHKTSAPGIVLNIMRSNNTAIVSWPFPSTGFVLESTTNRVLANWQAPGEAATTNNGRWQVTVPLNQPQRFFRLRQTSPGVSQSRHAVPSEGASLKYVPPGICPSLYASPNALNHHLYQTGRSATVRSRTLTVLIFPWPQVPRDWQGQPNAETTGSPATHRQCETALEPRALGSAGTWVIGFYSHFDFLIGFDLESSWKIHAKAEYAAHHHFC